MSTLERRAPLARARAERRRARPRRPSATTSASYVGAGIDGLLGATGVLAVAERMSANTAVYLLAAAASRDRCSAARRSRRDGARVASCSASASAARIATRCRFAASIPATRGRRMDEALQIVRRLLTGQPVDFDGEFFSLRRRPDRPSAVASDPDRRRRPLRRRAAACRPARRRLVRHLGVGGPLRHGDRDGGRRPPQTPVDSEPSWLNAAQHLGRRRR